jgi:hypothetical protein
MPLAAVFILGPGVHQFRFDEQIMKLSRQAPRLAARFTSGF